MYQKLFIFTLNPLFGNATTTPSFFDNLVTISRSSSKELTQKNKKSCILIQKLFCLKKIKMFFV